MLFGSNSKREQLAPGIRIPLRFQDPGERKRYLQLRAYIQPRKPQPYQLTETSVRDFAEAIMEARS